MDSPWLVLLQWFLVCQPTILWHYYTSSNDFSSAKPRRAFENFEWGNPVRLHKSALSEEAGAKVEWKKGVLHCRCK